MARQILKWGPIGALTLIVGSCLAVRNQASAPEAPLVVPPSTDAATTTAQDEEKIVQSSSVVLGKRVVFEGACDASGAVPIDDRHFALADDEDNIVRIYDADRGGPPLRQIDLTPQLGLDTTKKKKKIIESDLEAATSFGNHAYWLSSHGRNSSGKLKTERLVFFATNLPTVDNDLQVIGVPYRDLVDDLVAEPSLAPFSLDTARELPPKAPGGLNLEGLTSTPQGSLLLGLRSPIPKGKALIVPIENPSAILLGQKPHFGAPLLLNLGGLGVRALSSWKGQYLIVAGPPADGSSELFSWSGPGSEVVLVPGAVEGLNPEAFFTPEDRDEMMLLSDDGSTMIGNEMCKKVPVANKRFRGQWLRLSDLSESN